MPPESDRADVKQKLTLGISKDVIEKARAADINISAITEQVLKAITYEPKGSTKDDIVNAYGKLFKTASTVLDKYNAHVEVGRQNEYEGNPDDGYFVIDSYPIILDAKGSLWKYFEPDSGTGVDVASVLSQLDPPMKFLENLILALIDGAEKNKEKLKELEIALRFVKTLSGEEEKTTHK